MAQTDDTWSADSNEALEISIVKPSPTGLKTLATFHPQFTYPIFGDDERIFGYQRLKINLRYHANDMRPNLQIAYGKKFRAIGETQAADVEAVLKDFLPDVAFQKGADFEQAVQSVPKEWSPPGTLVTEFEAKDGQYSIWQGSLGDQTIKQMVDRIQILVPLFIEGGSFIKAEESEQSSEPEEQSKSLSRWAVFFLYRKRQVLGSDGEFSYEFAGYSTVYRFLFYSADANSHSSVEGNFELPTGEFSLTELPCRTRISQFILLPPFQGKGNAGRFYGAIFKHYLENPQTVEITVEDPNEAFDDLRDLADLAFLRKDAEFNELCIDTTVQIPEKGPAPRNIVDLNKFETLRKRAKIAPRQFARCVEMHLMSKLPDTVRPGIEDIVGNAGKGKASQSQQHEYDLWKLWVKQRIYRQGKDLLGQLEREERIEKLGQTLTNVELDYIRLLSKYDQRNELNDGATNGKRELEGAADERASKKARVEDA